MPATRRRNTHAHTLNVRALTAISLTLEFIASSALIRAREAWGGGFPVRFLLCTRAACVCVLQPAPTFTGGGGLLALALGYLNIHFAREPREKAHVSRAAFTARRKRFGARRRRRRHVCVCVCVPVCCVLLRRTHVRAHCRKQAQPSPAPVRFGEGFSLVPRDLWPNE